MNEKITFKQLNDEKYKSNKKAKVQLNYDTCAEFKTYLSLSEKIALTENVANQMIQSAKLFIDYKNTLLIAELIQRLSDDIELPFKKDEDGEKVLDNIILHEWIYNGSLNEFYNDFFVSTISVSKLKDESLTLYWLIRELRDMINEKIEFYKQQIIHNSNLVYKIDSIVDIIKTYTDVLKGVKPEDVQTLISTFSSLNADGFNISSFSDNIVNSFLKQKQNNNEIDEELLEGVHKEFQNVINFEEIVDNI